MSENLSNNLSEYYEKSTRFFLPPNTYTIIQIQNSNYTNFNTSNSGDKFSDEIMDCLKETASELLLKIPTAKLIFVNYYELDVLLYEFKYKDFGEWCDGDIQKIVTETTNFTTNTFNSLRLSKKIDKCSKEYFYIDGIEVCDVREYMFIDDLKYIKFIDFFAKCFTIPSRSDVIKYFIERQSNLIFDYTKNITNHLMFDDDHESNNKPDIDFNIINENIKGFIYLKDMYGFLASENKCPILHKDNKLLLDNIPENK